MPGGDRTGPLGRGARTGRGLGYCSGYDDGGFFFGRGRALSRGRGFGRGMGTGRGFGRGIGFRSFPAEEPLPPRDTAPSKEDEKEYLKRTLGDLEEEIKSIKSRLKELD